MLCTAAPKKHTGNDEPPDCTPLHLQEMDYNLEASNTITFKKQMASLQGIMVPTVHPEFTSRRVIVSDWIEGEKLADSKASDVRALCSTLLNCYLIQLLETGLLHADPHPGEQRALCCSVGGQRGSWGSPPAAQGRTLEREVLQAVTRSRGSPCSTARPVALSHQAKPDCGTPFALAAQVTSCARLTASLSSWTLAS